MEKMCIVLFVRHAFPYVIGTCLDRGMTQIDTRKHADICLNFTPEKFYLFTTNVTQPVNRYFL